MRNKCIFLFSTINLPTTTACGICNTSRSFLPVRKIPFYARLRPSGCHAPTSAAAPSVSARPLLQLRPSRSNFAFVPIRFVWRIIFKQVFACLNTFRSLRIIWARLRNNPNPQIPNISPIPRWHHIPHQRNAFPLHLPRSRRHHHHHHRFCYFRCRIVTGKKYYQSYDDTQMIIATIKLSIYV